MKLKRASLFAIVPLLFACKSEKKETPPPPPAEKPAEKPAEPAEAPPPAAAPEGFGTIRGTISFTGTPPAPEKVDMKKDPKCLEINKGGEQPDVIVTDGKLADVFVHVTNVPDQKWETRTDEVMLDQKGCIYIPRMIGIQTGQKLKVLNSDPLLHNVHAFAKRSEFNQAMPKQGQVMEQKFKAEDLAGRITCEVHPWMTAQLRVVDHPFYAVTKNDGAFTIENVPAGKYTLEMEHPTLGKKTQEVEVTAGGTVEANIAFGS